MFFNRSLIQFNSIFYCHLNHKTDLWLNKDKNILQVRKKTRITHAQCIMSSLSSVQETDDGQRKYLIFSPSPIY